jgi:PilZ domain-containing protein
VTGTPSERQYFRIQYPVAIRPQIVAGGRSLEVIDLSERGVRFKLDEEASYAVGDAFAGTVRLRRSEPVEVRGTVVRVTTRDIAVKLEIGVPLRVIIDEQRFLREHDRGLA